jgi:hypothetical protein
MTSPTSTTGGGGAAFCSFLQAVRMTAEQINETIEKDVNNDTFANSINLSSFINDCLLD